MPAGIDRRTLLAAMAASTPAQSGVRIGLITEATGDHLPYYVRAGQAKGVSEFAIADPSGNSKAPGAIAFASAAEMLERFRPKLAVITVEPHRAPAAVELALRAGIHVVVEKPGCTKLEQFESLAKLAETRGLQLMLAMATRLHPAALKAKELIAAGYIGKPYGVDMHWIADQTRIRNPEYRASWVAKRDKVGGGKLVFHGIHYLDLIQSLVSDRIARVSAFCRNVGGQPIEVEDAAVMSMVFAGGMVGTLNTGYYLDKGYANLIHLWGERGWLRFDPRAENSLEWYSTHPDAPKGVQKFRTGPVDVYAAMLQAAADFARGAAPPFMTTAESLSVLRVIFRGYRSAETGMAQDV
ncbi:MAG: Gfo/Idh/MocA family oxidoreductase [Bryobacteraceae bacterium]